MNRLSGRPRILVAEDDQALRRLLELRLQVDGYDVRSVADGSDALAAVEEWPPDALVCDVMMPRISGLTVCRELRANPEFSDIPIVLLTARVFDTDIEEVMALGGIVFVNKPFNASKLNSILQSVLGIEEVQVEANPAINWLKVKAPMVNSNEPTVS